MASLCIRQPEAQSWLSPFGCQTPSMRQRNFVANGQAQSCPLVASMRRAPESLEQQRELGSIESRPPVPHGHRIALDRHFDRRLRGRMLDGVLQ